MSGDDDIPRFLASIKEEIQEQERSGLRTLIINIKVARSLTKMVGALLRSNEEMQMKLLEMEARELHFEEQWKTVTMAIKMEDKAVETKEVDVIKRVEEMLLEEEAVAATSKKRKKSSGIYGR